jgi:hypothetical protein
MEDKLVTLKTYVSQIEAMVDLDVLESNGLDATISNEQLVEMYPMFGTIDEGLKILVFEKDLHQALELLDAFHASENH